MSSFSKNLRFYRLKSGMTKKELADKCQLTPMAISNYENGKRTPRYDLIEEIANVLNVRFVDLINTRDESLVFSYGEFRKSESLSGYQEELIKASTEDYLDSLLSAAFFISGKVLPDCPSCHVLNLSDNIENDAKALRQYLGFPLSGPIPNMITSLENKGILVYKCYDAGEAFSGMNGFVNDRPFIVINGNMNPERNRATMAHELAHLMFIRDDAMSSKAIESRVTAISGAFLIGLADLQLEVGIKRDEITSDMLMVCKKYGISSCLLVRRMKVTGIIEDSLEEQFYTDHPSWHEEEPSRIQDESSDLLEQLVLRAISEREISIMKGAELLKDNYDGVLNRLNRIREG
ncbi:MAG: XRE family transcriptional regulator [Clostridia bacterium]|nr:XRE family transcriptional regulator [Clostridia bacterium]